MKILVINEKEESVGINIIVWDSMILSEKWIRKMSEKMTEEIVYSFIYNDLQWKFEWKLSKKNDWRIVYSLI